jgi:ABC-type transporter Mla MlaB component
MSLDQLGPTTTPSSPVLATVSMNGELDDAAAARLLRWCEARLHLHDGGHARIDHLLIDLGHVRQVRLSALAILDHARTEAERRRVGIHLVGVGPLMAGSPAQVRHRLGRWRSFPTLDVARAALEPNGDGGVPTPRPVDPDAIILKTTIHDRLR